MDNLKIGAINTNEILFIYDNSDDNYQELLANFNSISYKEFITDNPLEEVEQDELLDRFLNCLKERVEAENTKLLVIAAQLDQEQGNSNPLGILLTAHIRLSDSLSEMPVIILSNSSLIEYVRGGRREHYTLFAANKIILLSLDVFYSDDGRFNGESFLKEANAFLRRQGGGENTFLDHYEFSYTETTERHSIANLWGVQEFIRLAGLNSEDLPQPTHLQIKLLLKQALHQGVNEKPRERPTLSSNLEPRKYKITVIDDQAEKGWSSCIKELMNLLLENTEGVDLKVFTSTSDIPNDFKYEDQDIVFLDLRLGEDDHSTQLEDLTGYRLLKEIKSKCGVTPVIMFTASNKAWNIQKLLDAGADGFYIKEHPSFRTVQGVSESNFNNLIGFIDTCIKKRQELIPFWRDIQKIKDNNLIIERNNSKIKERIIERLEMFLGLLKSSFEQSTHNQELFHFSAIELAFMTLWSCLNDLQYSYFDKQAPNGSTALKNWSLSQDLIEALNGLSQEELSFKKEYIKYLSSSNQETHYNIGTKELSESLIGGRFNFLRRTLKYQISFLIRSIDIAAALPTNVCDTMVSDLDDLAKKRNALYLTHGDESPGSNFFQKTIKEKRTDASSSIELNDCRLLFKIVYFLVKGSPPTP